MFNTWFNSGSRHFKLPAQLPVPTKLKRVASLPGTLARGIALAGTQRKNIAARRAADPHEVIRGAPLSEWRSRRRLRLQVQVQAQAHLGAVPIADPRPMTVLNDPPPPH